MEFFILAVIAAILIMLGFWVIGLVISVLWNIITTILGVSFKALIVLFLFLVNPILGIIALLAFIFIF